MNHYETLFIIKPTLTEEEIKSQVERVKSIIANQNGELLATQDMGMRKLAYEIDKQNRGYYTVVYYTAPADAISELERQLRYNEEILRFMTVKYSNKKEIAQYKKMVDAVSKSSSSEDTTKKASEATEASESAE